MGLPLNIDWQQILLHLFNFVLLAGGLYFLLYKPVKSFMDKRTEYYRGLEDEAKAKLEKAESVHAEYEALLGNAEKEIAAKKAESVRVSEEESAATVAKAKEQAESIIASARKSAEKEREEILEDARNEIVDMAAKATEKLLSEQSEGFAYDSFLDAAENGGK